MVIEEKKWPYSADLSLANSPALSVLGKLPPIEQPSVAVIASAKIPAQLLLQTHELAQQWRRERLTVISGFASPVEDEVWQLLWRDLWQGRSEVWLVPVLARRMLQRFTARQHHCLAVGQLTYISPFGDGVKRQTKETAYKRNLVAALLADRVFIPYAAPNSDTLRLVQQLLPLGKSIETWGTSHNRSLLDLGVEAIEPK